MRYTSDMTDSQWEIIKPILQEAKYRSNGSRLAARWL